MSERKHPEPDLLAFCLLCAVAAAALVRVIQIFIQ